MPENFEIAHIWVLWLVPLPLLVYWLLPTFKVKSSALLFPDYNNALAYTGEKEYSAARVKRRNIFSWIALWLIWICLIVALSSPQLVGKPEMKVKTSRNFLIVADLSFSMAETDWVMNGRRTTRWNAVKSVMKDFIAKREGDRMGLIFFGSSAYIQVPFTPELSVVEQMLEEADVGMAGQMTLIGKAIVKGIEMFSQDTIKTKVMLVLTDGVDVGTDILPLDAADLAKSDSILVYTIGIGDPGGSGADLDENTLKEISAITGAKYFRASDTKKFESIYDELNKLEPIEYEEENYKPRTLLYYYPLTVAIILAMIVAFLMSGIKIFLRFRDS